MPADDVAGAPAGTGSLQNASGCIASAYIRHSTKDGGTRVEFVLFGGHRGVAQGRPAGRIRPHGPSPRCESGLLTWLPLRPGMANPPRWPMALHPTE